MKAHLGWIAAAIAVASSGPAFAAASASASLGPLSIQLIDLDDSDGIMPGITFSTSAGGQDNYIWVGAGQNFGGIGDSQELHNLVPWAPISVSATTALAHVTASISGAGNAEGTTLSISGHANDFYNSNPNFFANFHAGIVGDPPYYSGGFTLSANSRVVISGDASVALNATTIHPNVGGQNDFAAADVYLRISGIGSDGSGFQSGNDSISRGAWASLGAPSIVSDGRTLAVSFENRTSGDLAGNLQVHLIVESISYAAAPVPEPESYALMLAGLFAVGGIARRRRG